MLWATGFRPSEPITAADLRGLPPQQVVAPPVMHPEFFAGGGGTSLCLSGLNPALAALGEFIGLLAAGGTDATYCVVPAWFADPYGNVKKAVSGDGTKLAQLLSQLLGSVAGQALGVPVKDPAIAGTWYPINLEGDDGKAVPTGLAIASYADTAAGTEVFGIGVMRRWDVGSPTKFTVEAFAMMPFVKVGGGGIEPVLTEPGYPITLGIAVEGADGGKLLDLGDVSCTGVKVGATLDLAKPAADASVVIMQLKLPDDAEPRDRSLSDLASASAAEIQSAAAALFIGALSEVSTTFAERAPYLMPLLGLSTKVPGSDAVLPLLRWDQLFEQAASGGAIAAPFQAWFTALTADPAAMAAWLAALADTMGETATVAGTGTRDDPFAVALIDASSGTTPIGVLSFTMASVVAGDGKRSLYPGLRFSTTPLAVPGTASSVLRLSAAAELAQFSLSPGGVTFGSPDDLDFSFTFALTDADATKPLAAADGYSFGALTAGLVLSAAVAPVPHLSLTNVVTPDSSYGAIDLLSPGQLATAAADILQGKILSLLGIPTGSTPGSFAHAVAALIGVVPPTGADGTWPAPPFSAAQLLNSLQHPLDALAAYYRTALTSTVGGTAAFTYLLGELANALHASASGTIAVTGDGTAASPWQAPLTTEGARPAVLTAYTQTAQRAAGPVTQLVLGLALAPQLTLDGTTVVPNLSFDLVSIDLPNAGSGAALTGNWAPRLSAGVALPAGFTGSPVGGVSFSMGPASLAASWNRVGGWNPELLVTDPVVTVGTTKIPLGQSLDLSDAAALEQLVTGEVKAFLDLVAAVIGLGLVRTGSRAGIAAAGIFGLLDVSSAPGFPSGTWPTIAPLALSGFQNPWPDLRAQLARDFADDRTGAGVLSLLAWAANTSLAALPAIAGTRAVAAPFVVPIGALSFDLLVWFTDAAQVLGLGAARSKTLTAGHVTVTSELRLNAFEYALQTGSIASGPNAPSLTLQTTIAGTAGAPLVPGSAASGILGSVVIGVTLALDANGGLTATPIVTLLDVTLPGEPVEAQITLADMQASGFAERLRQGFLQLLNAGIAQLGPAMQSDATLQTAYDLLADLGLALPRSPSTPLGINAGGWSALLADPAGFLARRLATLLRDPVQRDALFTFVLQQLGITLPAIPAGVLALLAALGFVGPAEQGYPLRLDALIALARNPLGTIAAAFERFAGDPGAITAIGTTLKGTFATKFGPFSLGVAGGSKIALGIARADALTIGGLVDLWGAANIDLAVPSIAVDLHVFAPAIEVEAISTLAYRPASGTAPAYALSLGWGDGTRPAPVPLTLYPFAASTFVPQLAQLAPAYVLSTLATAAFQSQLLQQYPLVQQIFTGLGLAEQVGGTWQMSGLLGFIADPKGWLLSEGILGSNGSFDVDGFAKWLGGFPAVTSSSGIAVAPQANGVAITGLPYGLSVALTGTNGKAQIAIAASGLSVAGGDGVFDLAVDVSLGPDYQPGFGGSVKATAAKLSVPFTVEAGYAGSFSLAVTQASGGLSLQILPFQGWGSLDAALGKLPFLLLQQLVPKLLDALSTAGATTFVTQLRASGTQLNVAALVSALEALPTPLTAAAIEDAALKWLLGALQPAQAPATAQAVAGLLQLVLPTQVKAVGGLVSYTPSASIPLTVLAGLDPVTTVAGLWLDIAFPVSLLSIAIERTGVGVPIAGGNPVISFGASLGVPIEPKTGPALTLAYDQTKGLTLSFDPLAPAQPGTPSFLARELLPAFFPAGTEQGDLAARVENWVLGVVTHVLPRYVAAIVLNQSDVATWLGTGIKGAGSPTPGAILEAASLLTPRTPSGYDLVDVDTLLKLTPETFVANFLQALLQTPLKLLAFGKNDDGEIWIGPNPSDPTSYGVRLTAPDFAIPDVDHVVLQLGAPLTDGWIEGSGGKPLLGDRLPGIAVWVPLKDGQGKIAPDFGKLQIDLVNVGADFVGVQNAPLLDFRRFQLGAFEARTLVLIALNDGSPTAHFGGAATLEDLALSLAPNTVTGGNNPVAQNLLGAGSKPAEQNPPVNPAFTLAAAYTQKLWVQLSSPTGSSNPVIIPVQRSFGPLHVDDFGVGWEPDPTPPLLDLLFDGSVALAGLQADLVGLEVGIPVTDITNVDAYKLDLQGLDISFKGGAVSISGAFLKTTNPLSYTGAALVQAAKFGLTAIGSYAVLPAPTEGDKNATAPSMFIFGALSAPLGGVPAFFITGVAAGFGYNRSLALPDVGEVQNFPLVSGVLTGSFSEGTTPAEAIEKMGTFVAPKVGDYWLAAGLKFTSFQLIDAVALLFLQFGRHIEIDLIGLASAPLPKGVPKGSALAYVELALKASIQPDEGIISIQAQLTPNSYVIAKDCKLTGGFAFVLYLKDITLGDAKVSAGDFVITLGGYHPAFRKPPQYPDVPRLGFNWKIDGGIGTVSISGGAYFALVPTAVMAGGYLDVTFDAGPLQAWLHAAANFLVQWAPFYFEVDISVSIGVSFGTSIAGVSVTLTIELGADLILEGPPTHGHADVTWYVISFTIPFGSGTNATSSDTLEWEPFAKQFLPPAPPPEEHAPQQLVALGVAAAAPPVQPLKATVEAGRLGGSNGTSSAPWVVQAIPFKLRIDSAIPTANLSVAGITTALQGPAVGVRPMGVTKDLDAPLTVSILDHTGKPVPLGQQQFTLTAVTNGAAGALWSKAALDEKSPPDPATMIVPGALMGVVLNATQYAGSDTVPAFPIQLLAYQTIQPILLPFAKPPQYGPADRYTDAQQKTSLALLMGSIATDAVAQRRNAAFATLRPFTTVAAADPNLTVMATSANLVVQAPPTLARPGVFQVLVPPVGTAVTVAPTAAVPEPGSAPREAAAARLVGSLRSYRSRSVAPAPPLAGLPQIEPVLPRFVDETHGRAARSHVRALAASAASVALYPGSLALWEVDDQAPHAIDATGDPGLRAVCFDRYGQAIADVYDVPGGAHALPEGTRLVAVHANGGAAGLVGWQIDTLLVRMNRYYALGPGCLVRVQNVHGPQSAGKTGRREVVSGAAFVDGNTVTGAGGVTRPGWIETVLRGGVRSFSVAIHGNADAAAGVRVFAAHDPSPGRVGSEPLAPRHVHVAGEVTVLSYAAPASTGDGSLTVIVRPVDLAAPVVGVYAGDYAPHETEHRWSAFTLAHAAVDADHDLPVPKHRVTIVAAAQSVTPLVAAPTSHAASRSA